MPEWIEKMHASELIAAYAAVLSTAIAICQIWVWYAKRPRLDVSYQFSSSEVDGNTIILRNLSEQQLILTYWELLYCEGRRPQRKFEIIASSAHDARDSIIRPHDIHNLNFTGADYFGWKQKFLRGRSIYIRVAIAGKKPELHLIYKGCQSTT